MDYWHDLLRQALSYCFLVDLDREGPEPPYVQVAAILRARIKSGELPPRRRLPSINDLVGEFGIARTTASKALHLLIEEGLAETVRGMGTYVRASRL
jgi:GntR family transcriptional regulator